MAVLWVLTVALVGVVAGWHWRGFRYALQERRDAAARLQRTIRALARKSGHITLVGLAALALLALWWVWLRR